MIALRHYQAFLKSIGVLSGEVQKIRTDLATATKLYLTISLVSFFVLGPRVEFAKLRSEAICFSVRELEIKLEIDDSPLKEKVECFGGVKRTIWRIANEDFSIDDVIALFL